MSFRHKLRKLILHPIDFFRDSKKFSGLSAVPRENSSPVPPKTPAPAIKTPPKTPAPAIKTPPKTPAPKTSVNKNDAFFQEMEKNILQIVNFAKSYPVNSLRWESGEILWPAFRFYLTLLANCYILGKLKTPRVFQPFPAFQWRKYYLENNFVSPVEKYIPEGEYDFIVFSALRSVSWVNDGEKIHDRLMDPLIEKLQQHGKTKKIIIVNASGEFPSNLAITPDYIIFPVQYKINNSYSLNNFDMFASKIVNTFKQYEINRSDLAYFLDIFIYLYSNYIKLLRALKPKAVFFFPIDYSTPLIMAAHSLGIKAIDIQHGNMIGYYIQYNRWDEQYPKGYNLWPDAILTWSKREKNHVQKLFKGHINAIVFGYPWLEKLLEKEQLLKNKKLAKFRSLFKYIVIVSLSEHDYLPATMDSIVKDQRSENLSIGFVFKRNPKRTQTVLPQRKNVYTDDTITTSSFLSVAQYADLHMTEVSSCLYEADYIGLNTILTGNSWEFHFKDLVESERVYHAKSADDFYALFEKLVSFCHYPRLFDNSSPEFDEFMKTLLQENR